MTIFLGVSGLNYGQAIMQYPNAMDRDQLIQLKETLEQQEHNQLNYSVFDFFYHDVDGVESALKMLDPAIEVKQLKHQLVVYHKKRLTNDVNHIIKTVNRPAKKILLSFYVYEVNYDTEKELNLLNVPVESGAALSWNQFGVDNSLLMFDQIKLLEQKGRASLMSEPTIEVINEQESEFDIGEKIPYITSTTTATQTSQSLSHIQTGFNVRCEPKIMTDQSVFCKLKLNIQAVKLWKIIADNEYPILTSRMLNISSQLPNNELRLIATFKDQYIKRNQSSIPFLGYFSWLKWLFGQRNSQETQTLIYIFLKAVIHENVP